MRRSQLYASLILASFIAVLLVACATNRAVYNTLASTKATTDTGISTYFDLVVSGKVRTNGVPIVAKSYNSFMVVWGAAVDLAASGTNAPTPDLVLNAASNVLWTIAMQSGGAK